MASKYSITRALIITGWLASMAFSSHSSQAVELFIIAGQSNARGVAPTSGLTLEQKLPQTDVQFWYQTDLGSSGNSFIDLKPVASTFGSELEAGRVLARELSEEVAIVKVAFGGATLVQVPAADWSPNSTGERYDALISNVTAARDKLVADGKTVNLAGMFWMQGGSDAKSSGGGISPPPQPSSAEDYEANLTELILRTRTDLSAPQLPFFVGEINIGDGSSFETSFGTFDFTPTVQAGQAAVAASDPDVYFVETDTFELLADRIHLNTSGQLDLGTAFAESYLETVPEPTSGVLILTGLLGLGTVRMRGPIR